MEPLVEVFGRLHPMVLHLPIGLIVGLAALELLASLRREQPPLTARQSLAWLGVISTLIALGTGLVLQLEDGYGGDTLTNHRLLGIALSIAACITAVLFHVRSKAWPRRAALLLTLGLLIPAGHLGASMTHGENFLLAPLSRSSGSTSSPLVRIPDDPAPSGITRFAADIQPILTANCISCHGPAKKKGGLALDSSEAIIAGADGIPIITPGVPAQSELLSRLRLPLDDEYHMPPEGKPQPSESDIAAIEAWIAAGASFTEPSARTSQTDNPAGNTHSAVESLPAAPAKPPQPPPEAVQALVDNLIHVEPIAADQPLLVVNFAAVASDLDEAQIVALLSPLKDFIADLSLARSAADDRTLQLIGEMKSLHRLDLRSTPIASAALAMLRGHPKLEELVLSQCELDDDAAPLLAELPRLRRVYLWRSGLSDAALEELQASNHELIINTGASLTTDALAAEEEVKFTSDAPIPGAAPAVTDLTPVNTVCPVSGSPVKPEYAIVYKGRVIGFCCPNCPREFWLDPGKYEANIK